MKKLMIAAAIVCAAVVSQGAASAWVWSLDGSLWDAHGKSSEGGAKITENATAYLFLADAYTQDNLLTAMKDGATLAQVWATSGATTAPTLSVLDDGTFDMSEKFMAADENDHNWFAAIVADDMDGKVYLTDLVPAAGSVNPNDPSYITFEELTANSRLPVNDGAFSAAGWYTASAVPEPTSGLLLLLGVAGLALRRRRA